MNDLFDWKKFNQYMQNQFSNLKPELPHIDFSWIENIVKDTVHSAAPEYKSRVPGQFTVELFEMLNYVIVKVKVPEDLPLNSVHLTANSTSLQIEDENNQRKQLIKLPSVIDVSAAKAIYQNGIVEIRLPKKYLSDPFREIKIRSTGK